MWEPPPWAFGAVWTPLYTTIAYAGGVRWTPPPAGGKAGCWPRAWPSTSP
ncbi:tryptophan-rich sensory protein [Streptomyces collinus]